eukprot:jgi/Galph1/1692/GphlegSOOS_G378.1
MNQLESQASVQSSAVTPAQIWQQINYTKLKEEMENMSTTILGHQNQSKTTRKAIIDATKEFKQSSADEKAKNLQGLLKAYQSEIDRLTSRASFAETCFFTVYQKLYATPDPCIFLSEIQEWREQALCLREEKNELKTELEQYKREVENVQTQDVTIRELQSQLRNIRIEEERKLAKRIEQVEAEWEETMKQTKRQYESEQMGLRQELEQYKDKLQTQQNSYDMVQTRLFETSHQLEETRAVKKRECEMLIHELEQSRQQNSTLNQRIVDLQNKLECLQQGKLALYLEEEFWVYILINDTGKSSGEDLPFKLVWKDGKIAQLEDVVQTLNRQKEEAEFSHKKEREEWEKILAQKKSEIQQLQKKVEEAPTKEEVVELKKKIETLQALQFDTVEDNDNIAEKQSAGLESLLMEKNRMLEDQLSHLRVKNEECMSQIVRYQQQNESLEDALADQREASKKLEDALNEALKHSKDRNDTLFLNRNANSNDKENSERSLLDIVCAQRDRYKSKALELEEQLDKMKEKASRLNATIESLKTEQRYISDGMVFDTRRKAIDSDSFSLMLEQGSSSFTWPETSRGFRKKWFRQKKSFERLISL